MPDFVKVFCYNRYDNSVIVPIYFNIKNIDAIEMVVDKDENMHMVHLKNVSFRLIKDSYDYLVKLVYGEEYKDDGNKG